MQPGLGTVLCLHHPCRSLTWIPTVTPTTCEMASSKHRGSPFPLLLLLESGRKGQNMQIPSSKIRSPFHHQKIPPPQMSPSLKKGLHFRVQGHYSTSITREDEGPASSLVWSCCCRHAALTRLDPKGRLQRWAVSYAFSEERPVMSPQGLRTVSKAARGM